MSPYRTLRRIQVIVALMMILSVFVGSPIAQADVRLSGDSGPFPETLDCDFYWIDGTSGYDPSGDKTTFTYTVAVSVSAPHNLSHWVLVLDTCVGTEDIAAASHGYTFGTDPTTGLAGIKFDVPVNTGQTTTFWIQFYGYWPTGMTTAAVKASNEFCRRDVSGPVCEVPTYSISGTKWHDLNADGVRDAGEPVLQGWTIQLKDAQGQVIDTAITDANGAYSFSDLMPGSYTVAEVLQPGYEQTFPAGDGTHSVTISNANVTGVNFGNWEPEEPTYGIAGQKWDDADADGEQDSGEDGLDGWTIQLWQNGSVISTTTTSNGGYYYFSNLPAGTYSVTEVLQSGWQQTFPVGGSHQVVLPDDEDGDGIAFGVDFGNRQLGGLEVDKRVFGGDGTFEICIVGPSFGSGSCQSTSGGTVSWSDLIPGTYSVNETDPGARWMVDVAPSQVTVVGGVTATAIITNTYIPELGSIRVVKVTDPSGDPKEFGFTFETTDFALQDGGQRLFSDLAAGTYSITETVPAGWDLTDVTCVEVQPQVAIAVSLPYYEYAGTSAIVHLGEGDHVVCTFTNTKLPEPTYGISGAKWNDLDGDGTWDISDPVESGLSGWTIQLWQNGSVISTTVTGEGGAYSFTNLPLGTYSVTEVLQSGWVQTSPIGGQHVVSLPEDANENGVAASYDFGNKQDLKVVTYKVSGIKWNDVDGDGVKDAGESVLKDWEIVLTSGDLVVKATTDANGYYEFTNLEPGTYIVAETQQSGWVQTFPSDPNTHTVIVSNADVANVNFGNRIPETPTYDLSGFKWEDLDGDTTWDAGEPGLSGWTIQLKDASGTVVATTVTGAGGAYKFTGLLPGSYTIAEVLQSGWTQTFPGGAGTHAVTISNASIANVNFGNRYTYKAPTYSISGAKWNDEDGDGVKENGEPGLGGWEIVLTSGDLVITTTTAADGSYSFDNLEPGTYVVAEVQQSGWKRTFPTGGGTHAVELVEASVTGVNFGNYRPLEQTPTPEPCIRSDVAVVVYGGWNGIPVRAWVGGTEQQTLTTAVDAFGQQQVMWTFYPPANSSWSVAVQPQTPEGKDPARWQYRLLRIESASQGTVNNNPGSASVSITRCNQYVLYFQLMDNGTTPDVAPTPPSEPQLPVTGGGPEPILAGGLGLFAALSGLGWSIRRRR